jgi:hypothetical protein
MPFDPPLGRTAVRRYGPVASDWVTWEPCPRCGSRAAVGWGPEAHCAPGDADDGPMEFDCPTGCAADPRELLAWGGYR